MIRNSPSGKSVCNGLIVNIISKLYSSFTLCVCLGDKIDFLIC